MQNETVHTELLDELRLVTGLTVKPTEPLARYTSIKIGGAADYFVAVESAAALAALLRALQRHDVPFWLVGNGSNILISDDGIRGAVVHLTGEFKRVEWREEVEMVRGEAGAAAAVTQLVRQAARHGYAGLEFAEGIPGTMGGALVMNAGAYGSEFDKIVEEVEGTTAQGEPIRLRRKELNFTYRDSHLPPGTIVTRVHLRLGRQPADLVRSRLRELVAKRKNSQPSGYPNCGSVFRNPPGDFAGRLIEAAGLKGKKIGRSQISERHANFIVNLGGARAEEVRGLMELARAEVKRQFGVDLVPEVRLLGEWSA